MTSSADLVLLLALGLFPAAVPVPGAPAAPEGLAREVRAEIASRWSVDAERIALEWPAGSLERLDPSADPRAERVLGGAGGWFTVATGTPGDAPALRVHAGLFTPVAVAARALATGEHLAAEDMREETRVVFGPPLHTAHAIAAGDEVRRPISAGETLAWPAVGAPEVIEAGQPVSVIWDRSGVQVRLEGVALQSARAGEPVRVRVAGRTGHLNGIAAAKGAVRLEGGRP